MAGDDADGGEVERQQRVRLRRVQAEGERVHHLDARDRAQEAAEAARAVRHLRRALEGEDDVVGGEVAAVVPLHAAAELELPQRLGERPVALGEQGTRARARVPLHQPVEDVHGQALFGEAL